MIQINLLRISPDSKYLEFSVECPLFYKFNKLYIKKYDYTPNTSPVDVDGNPTDDGWRDCSHLYTPGNIQKQVMRISTIALSSGFNNGTPQTIVPDAKGNSASSMFYVQFGTTYTGTATPYNSSTTYAVGNTVSSGLDTYKSKQSTNLNKPLTDTAWWELLLPINDVIGVTSDINNIYIILKDQLLNLDNTCIDKNTYQSLLRNYMFTYAHTEAMRLERFDEAEMFYDIIKKSFVSCTTSRDKNTRLVSPSCGCN